MAGRKAAEMIRTRTRLKVVDPKATKPVDPLDDDDDPSLLWIAAGSSPGNNNTNC